MCHGRALGSENQRDISSLSRELADQDRMKLVGEFPQTRIKTRVPISALTLLAQRTFVYRLAEGFTYHPTQNSS